MEVVLALMIIFSNGNTLSETRPTTGWDDCYLKGIELTQKLEKNPEVDALVLTCEMREVRQ